LFSKIKQLSWKVLLYRSFVYGFAIIGFGLCSAWLAVKLKLTNDPGSVDVNDRYFQHATLTNEQRRALLTDSAQLESLKSLTYFKILALGVSHPKNARNILDYYRRTEDVRTVEHMLDAMGIYMTDSTDFQKRVTEDGKIFSEKNHNTSNLFWWSTIEEWPVLKVAVAKDAKVIDTVAKRTGANPRLISAVLIAEQIRLFDSRREAFKKWIQPLKILSNETTFSWGVTGIKDFTAKTIEHNLIDKTSPFYMGAAYEHLLDFKTDNP